MLTFYDYLPSQNGWKVRLLLAHLGRAHERRLVSIFDGQGQAPDYLAVSPLGAVPGLVLDDGRSLAESGAILWYLAEGSPYLPDDPFGRAKVLQWIAFEAANVQPTLGMMRYLRLTQGDRMFSAPGTPTANRGARALQAMDGQLAQTPFLAGDAYTIADMALYAYTHLAEDAGLELSGLPHLLAWFDRVRAQPGFCAEVYPYSVDPSSANPLPSFAPP